MMTVKNSNADEDERLVGPAHHARSTKKSARKKYQLIHQLSRKKSLVSEILSEK